MLPTYRTQQGRGGLRADAAVAGSSDLPSTGTVTFIDNSVDQTTDTIRLKATFPNADHRLWPGQFVEVTLRLSVDEHAIVAPAIAVQPSQQGTFVWVVNPDQTVVLRPVTVTRSEGQASVIGSGLRAGEVVVTDGQLRLTPGAHISIKTPAPPGGRGPS
jgi:multidrug efflux system membrane fusion protein